MVLARRLVHFQATVQDKRDYIRMQAVLLVLRGVAPSTAGAALGCTRQAVNKWVRRYLSGGDPAALLTKPRSGRPLQGTDLRKETISEVLGLNPLTLGYKVGAWTVAALQRYLLDYQNITIGPHTLRRRLHQWGFRYKRPRYVYEEKEPNLGQKKGRL